MPSLSDDADPMGPNIMFDPRVVRGSTFSQHNRDTLVGTATTTVVSGGGAFPPPAQSASGGARGSGLAAARATASEAAARQKKLKWREKSIYDYRAPPGRDSVLDLSAHLVERTKVVAVAAADAQTDGFEPMPAAAPYVPQKTGKDSATQMDAQDQPFEFDRDVAPLLAVVVRKTLEQALLEVEQEAELAAIARDLALLEAEKDADAKRIATLEARTAAKQGAKRGAVAAARAKAAREQTAREKVCAVRLMAQCWPGVKDGTFAGLEAVGTWCSPTVRQVRGDVLPWLYDETARSLQRRAVAEALVADVASAAIAQQTARASEVLAGRQEARDDAARGLRGGGWVRIFLDGASLGLEADAVVGPIQVGGSDTIADVEVKIATWLVANGIVVSLPEGGFLHLALDGKQLDSGSRLLDESVGDNAKLEVVLPPAE